MQSLTTVATKDEPTSEAEPGSSRSAAAECRQLVRRFGDVTALDGVSLSIRQGEFFSLLGPSGCGKTTLLRLLAGLDIPDAGQIWLAGLDMTRVPPQRRPVNTVFQSYALFPHLTVWDNVAFGLRMKGVPEPQVRQKVQEVLALVRIEGLEHRRPAQLSGGQQQRVALARALVNQPQVLLLDEPLGALDLQLRKQLQTELRQMQRRLGLTFLHVTHDQAEAMSLSDRIAVMKAGRIEQIGTPRELYEHPRTRFVAQFLGSCNLIEGTALEWGGHHLRVQTCYGWLEVSRTGPMSAGAPARTGGTLTLAIRPEQIRLRAPVDGFRETNSIRAVVEETVFLGSAVEYRLRSAGRLLLALEPRHGKNGFLWQPGDHVTCCLPSEALTLLDD